MSTRALTLVEVIIALALLAVVLLAFASVATTSMSATSDARPNFIAQECASRLLEQMRMGKVLPDIPATGDAVYETYFLNYAGAHKPTIGGTVYAAPSLDVPASYTGTPYASPFTELQLAFRRGLLRRPSDSEPARPLRVRFLDELQYQTMFALPAAFDLDLNGSIVAGVNTNYRLFPVFIEVRWRDGPGPDRVHQLKAVLGGQAPLDPARGG